MKHTVYVMASDAVGEGMWLLCDCGWSQDTDSDEPLIVDLTAAAETHKQEVGA